MSDCTHDCSTCGESCGERKEVNVFEKKPLRPGCRVGKVYGVVSGKGGVGKSMVTSQLAVADAPPRGCPRRWRPDGHSGCCLPPCR